MEFKDIQFSGDWAFPIYLPAFAGFRERNGPYTSMSSSGSANGTLTVEFEDDLTENPDPYPEQMRTLQYIFEHQDSIVAAIVKHTLQELPAIITDYGLQAEAEFLNVNIHNIKSLIGFNGITIKLVSKDGYAYFDVTGGCSWDEEHGLNILFYKDKVISLGGIDGNSYWEAVKDNRTYNEIKDQHRRVEVPKKYYPHPKYNKLKPSQRFENETYEYSLIAGGFNDLFIKGVNNGEIDINGKWESQDKTYLEAACWFNNQELVSFLLSKKADIRYALYACTSYNNHPIVLELLKNGAHINSQYKDGNTVLFKLVSSLESIYRTIEFNASNKEVSEGSIQDLNEHKEQIKGLIAIGADPFIKNFHGFNCFDILRNAKEERRTEVNHFLKQCLEEQKVCANKDAIQKRQRGLLSVLWNKLTKR